MSSAAAGQPGSAAYDGQETLEEFLERVDMKMYEDKAQKKQ